MYARKLIVIADAHLGVKAGDIDVMIRFISSLEPAHTELLILGDLFHIWAGPKKFRTVSVERLLTHLTKFRSNGGVCYLVTGNRDVFFREQIQLKATSELPFDRIAVEELVLERKGGRLLAVHGDTINSKDIRYLKWRRLIRQWWFQLPFHMIPSRVAKKIMFGLEAKLKQTNLEFRRDFPEGEWNRFLEQTYHSHGSVMLLAGHFHPKQIVEGKFRSATGLVLPDWCDNFFYLEVADDLSYRSHRFTP